MLSATTLVRGPSIASKKRTAPSNATMKAEEERMSQSLSS
ncbi:hypothetical protein NKDENANG_00772 [Candidatus Entotheonellaceae bacterium PAL068K]